ncbi:MAG TPA: glycogen debranching enzyme N-terminal domain-containing protein, partial [Polyangia bacterium]
MIQVSRVGWQRDERNANEALVDREWLVTNGLGGYASGTLAGVVRRRYHGLLVAALPNPFGRTMMLDHLVEHLGLPDGSVRRLSAEETDAGTALHGTEHLVEFRLEMGLPIWTFVL